MSCNWPKVTLRDAGIILIDCDHKTPKAQTSGFPYIGIPQLKKGHVTFDKVRLISEEDFHHWRRKAKPQTHDVILSRRCNPGVTAYIHDGLEIALGQNLVLLRADGKHVYPPYLRWLTNGPHWWREVNAFINVGAVFESLKCADIPKLEITLPPYAEQKKISELLAAIGDKIILNTQTNQTLEAMAQALFKSWFVDFDPVKAKIRGEQPVAMDAGYLPKEVAALFPEKLVESELGLIPDGWGIGKICDLFELHRGFDLPKSKRINGGYPVYAAGGIHSMHNEYKMEPPGIITGRSGVIGNVYLSLERYWPLNTALYVRDFRLCGPYYAFFTLKSIDLKKLNSGSAVPSLNRNFVHSLSTIIPNTVLLNLFEKLVKPMFEKIAKNIEHSKSLAELRDVLLPKLLSGEISLEQEKLEVING